MCMDTRTRFDKALDALRHIKRRQILINLYEGGRTAGESENEEKNAVLSVAESERECTSEIRESMTTMQHKHLPKLEALGFVEWDRENQYVTRGPQFREIEPLLELLNENLDELPDGWV